MRQAWNDPVLLRADRDNYPEGFKFLALFPCGAKRECRIARSPTLNNALVIKGMDIGQWTLDEIQGWMPLAQK